MFATRKISNETSRRWGQRLSLHVAGIFQSQAIPPESRITPHVIALLESTHGLCSQGPKRKCLWGSAPWEVVAWFQGWGETCVKWEPNWSRNGRHSSYMPRPLLLSLAQDTILSVEPSSHSMRACKYVRKCIIPLPPGSRLRCLLSRAQRSSW